MQRHPCRRCSPCAGPHGDAAADFALRVQWPPSPRRHAGISIFPLPTTARGFESTPVTKIGGVRTNATFHEAVRVPETNGIDGEGIGWASSLARSTTRELPC